VKIGTPLPRVKNVIAHATAKKPHLARPAYLSLSVSPRSSLFSLSSLSLLLPLSHLSPSLRLFFLSRHTLSLPLSLGVLWPPSLPPSLSLSFFFLLSIGVYKVIAIRSRTKSEKREKKRGEKGERKGREGRRERRGKRRTSVVGLRPFEAR
jgi:hypothetical protein